MGIYLGGRSVISMTKANLNMMITKGAPSYANEYNSEFTNLFLVNNSFDIKSIQIPEYGAHYGNIICDRVDMKVPLYYGDSEEILEKGAGQYIASGLPGEARQILIGGHDSVYFAPLEYMEIGDTVEVITNYGEFTYQVTSTKIADALDTTTYSLTKEEEELVLYTCYPFGGLLGDSNNRYFVYCKRLDN